MKSAYPKISVFVPTYNQKAFVHEALESILIQDYPNLEIVVGDDGSVDGTQEILLEYKEKYPEIFKLILSPINEGITANGNKILKECTGEYLAMFAGDDIWMPGKLLKQIRLMESNPDASICVSKVEFFESKTNKTMFINPSSDFNVENMSIIEIAHYIGSNGASFMVRKEAIPKYGFEPSIPMVSDWLFVIEILRKGKLVFINEALARYRRHGESMSNFRDLIFRDQMQTLFLLETKYEDMKVDVSDFIKKYILLNAARIFKSTNNPELKRNHLSAILSSVSMASLTKIVLREAINRISKKLKGVH
jgi:glycosyltransferase involved in cell wall biosynthesis